MKILVAGSRNVPGLTNVHVASGLAIICHWLGVKASQVTVIHGDARGVDRIAGDAAQRLGFKVKACPADWDKHGKRAGFLRNEYMVKLLKPGDITLAIWDGESRGTAHTISLCRNAGKRIIVVHPDTLIAASNDYLASLRGGQKGAAA